MKQKGLFIALIVGLVMSVAISCNDGKVFDQYVHTPIAGWEKNDTLTYNVPSVAQTGVYQSWLGLRIGDNYPFTAITMIVEQHILPADTVIRDTLNCKLTDAEGNYNGNGLNSYQYSFPITEMQLQQGDSIYVRIRHNMKREILPGISDVGIAIMASQVAVSVEAKEDK